MDLQKQLNGFKQVLLMEPKNQQALLNLAELLMNSGDKKGAIAVYETALFYYPDELGVYYCLSYLTDKYLTSHVKKVAEESLNKKETSPVIRSYAFFILAKFYNLANEYHQELDHLIRGHEMVLKSEAFNQPSSFFLEDLQRYKKDPYFGMACEEVESAGPELAKPIFIIGTPRSGSTLIENIICAADDNIFKGEETSIICHELFKSMSSEVSGSVQNTHSFKEKMLAKYSQFGVESSLKMTDKSLENIFMVGLIVKLFPKAKIIYCRRNTVSSIVSILQNNMRSLPWTHSLGEIVQYMSHCTDAINYWNETYPGLVYELEYEKLVCDHEVEAKKLLAYCDIKWTKKCLEFHKKKGNISSTASTSQIRQPINQDSLNKHKKYESFFQALSYDV